VGVVGRSVVVVLGVVCVVLAFGFVGVVVNYTAMISEKDQIISMLKFQVMSLQKQVNELNVELAARDLEISQLQVWLEGNRTLLIQVQGELEKRTLYYESRIASLNFQITVLQNELNAYRNSYGSLRDRVNQRWNHVNVESFITPQDQAVRDIVYAITGGWGNPSDWNEFWRDVKAMYDWVVNNIEYRYDGLYPALPNDPSGNLDFYSEMWQFPNETLKLRRGDCEDIAILLCSMIRCYSGMRCWAECIIIKSSIAGHVAVQIPVSGYKLVILDPAGKYYSRDFWGNIAFKDITTEINNWLNYWKPWMGSDVHVTRVFSDYIDKTFTSTNEYISWMYSRNL